MENSKKFSNGDKVQDENGKVWVFINSDGDYGFLNSEDGSEDTYILKSQLVEVSPVDDSSVFEVGSTYFHTFISDSSCKVFYTVTKRTAKTIWVQNIVNGEERGEISSFRIFDFDGEEAIRPEGSYSMAPIMHAGKIVKEETPEVSEMDQWISNFTVSVKLLTGKDFSDFCEFDLHKKVCSALIGTDFGGFKKEQILNKIINL